MRDPRPPTRRIAALSAVVALAVLGGCSSDEGTSAVGPTQPRGVPQTDNAGNDAPIVRIDQAPETVTLQQGGEVAFTGSVDDPDHKGDKAPVPKWDFGDGASAEGAAPPAHRYPDRGTYLVTLSATDADGARATPAYRLVQVGERVEPKGNSALRFNGTGRDDIDRVKIPMEDPSGVRSSFGANIGATDFTIELWVRAKPGANATGPVECGDGTNWIYGNILLDRDRYGPGRDFGLSIAGGKAAFGVAVVPDGNQHVTMCGKTQLDDDRWHHLAITRSVGTGAITLFVDGRLDSRMDAGPVGDISYPAGARPLPNCPGDQPCTLSDPYLVIGAEKHDATPGTPGYIGLVDELRLSTSIRYTGPFTPPTARFAPDAQTAALYHFDENGGPIAGDSATAPGAPTHGLVRYGGSPVGPSWVTSDAPTG